MYVCMYYECINEYISIFMYVYMYVCVCISI